MRVSLSHGGPNLYKGNEAPDRLLVGTMDGIANMTQSSGKWGDAGRHLAGKHVSAILDLGAQGVLFAGTHGDGLYRSRDAGRSWLDVSNGLKSGNIYSLNAVSVGGQFRVYAGTEPAHLHISSDLGDTWEELPALRDVPSVPNWTFPGPPHEAHVKNLAFDPRSPDTIYAAIEVGGLLRSTDGGRSWQELSGFYEDVHRIALRPSAPDQITLSTGNGIWQSLDNGNSWKQLTDRSTRIAYPDALVIHPENNDLIFTAGAISNPGSWRETHTADARVGRSRDGARTWEFPGKGLPEHIQGNIEAMSMAVWPGAYALFAGTTDGDVFSSADEGESWTTIVSSLPPVSKGGHYRNLRTPDAREPVAAH